MRNTRTAVHRKEERQSVKLQANGRNGWVMQQNMTKLDSLIAELESMQQADDRAEEKFPTGNFHG